MATSKRPIGLAEIAKILGVAEATPTRWRYRQEQTGFPEPDGFISTTVPFWWDTTIERWARKTHRWPGEVTEAEAAAAALAGV